MSDVNGFLTRPLVLICPGGGYEFTFDRKAEAIAVQYIARGFHACVLRYSVVPAKFPQSLYELAWSVAYLRKHAAEYGIKPDKIIVAGFSAGGHLAASLGVFWDKDWLAKETELSAEQMKPNGLLLSYPVIASGKYAYRSSIENLMRKKEQRIRRTFKSGTSGRKTGAACIYLAYLNRPVDSNPEYTDVYGRAGKESGLCRSPHFPGRTAWTLPCQ